MKKIFLLALILLAGCGANRREFEEYSLRNPSDYVLTQDNHPHGYRQEQCFQCHVVDNIHRDNQTGASTLELARELTRSQGISSCATCHGSNGR